MNRPAFMACINAATAGCCLTLAINDLTYLLGAAWTIAACWWLLRKVPA